MVGLEGKRKGAMATYCVTGATGFIGSWLVNTLLERGHMVHATVRDPGLLPHQPLTFACFGSSSFSFHPSRKTYGFLCSDLFVFMVDMN